MPKSETSMFSLATPPKVITFDCYGTLVQWYEVLLRDITTILNRHQASDANPAAILESFSARGRLLTAERPHRLYRDILRVGFAEAFREHNLNPTTEDIETVASAPMTMGPHPEVAGALQRLRTHYKLAIFTNSDDDLIAPTVARIGVPFDYVITAQQARAYKPSRQLFEYGYRTMGVEPHETVHVAMGMYWDMKARHELGLSGIWVNRRDEIGNPEWLPYAEVSNLNEAADLLLANVS